MRPTRTKLLTCGLLGVAGAVALLLPEHLAMEPAFARPAGDEIVLYGIVRDFQEGHADFERTPSAGVGHYAGNVQIDIGPADLPLFDPDGFKVREEWRQLAFMFSAEGKPVSPHIEGMPGPCRPTFDYVGRRDRSGAGAITSASSFAEWFSDAPSTNLSKSHAITLVWGADGAYEYTSNAFHPIDDMMLGNEGHGHNHHLTYAIRADFTYEACGGQFIEIAGGDGFWGFVDGRLVLDLGGVRAATEQYIDLDRLGLADGATCELLLFYAQRTASTTTFSLKTNVELQSNPMVAAVTVSYD